jgi:hypothetical protein
MENRWLSNVIYDSGDLFLPEKIKRVLEIDLIGSSKKTFYISIWSLIHVVSGVILGYIYLYLNYDTRFYTNNMFVIHTIWEFWQILIGMSKPHKFSGGGNLLDIVLDTILFMIGAYIVRKYNR